MRPPPPGDATFTPDDAEVKGLDAAQIAQIVHQTLHPEPPR